MTGMKKKLGRGMIPCFVLLASLLWKTAPSAGQAQEERGQKVTVTAVEVPVRVVRNGLFIKDLAKEDFEVFANGIQQEITAFETRTRRISAPAREMPGEPRAVKEEERVFFLIFNIFDYTDQVGEAIDRFFAEIFRKGDRILVLVEGSLLDIETGRGVRRVAENLKDTLKKYKVISSMQILKAYGDLANQADRLLASLRNPVQVGAMMIDQAILSFYDNYHRIWQEYKRQFIAPDTLLYGSLLKKVKAMNGEKWALCFQQREMFPELKNEGTLERAIREWVEAMSMSESGVDRAMARNVQAKQMSLQRLFDVSTEFPTATLESLFLEARVTFHFILLKSPRTLMTRDFELREVGRDFEDAFKRISRSTGGITVFSNKVEEALREASEAEDTFYLLVYTPSEDLAKKPQDIDVRVSREGAEVIHFKRYVRELFPPVAIRDFSAPGKAIRFSIVDYQRTTIEGALTGLVEVKIVIFDGNGDKVYDEAKVLQTVKEETRISIPFDQLGSGYHFLIIQVIDRISNTIDVYSRPLTF